MNNRDRASRVRCWLALLSVSLVVGTSASAGSQASLAVSGTAASPLAGCIADAIEAQPGVNFPNTEVEPYLVVNPTNPENVVATWQQDRWNNGGARANLVATSADGGVTWTLAAATKSSICAGGSVANGGDLPRATDPWLSFAPNGDLYLMSLSFQSVFGQPGASGVAESAMLVSKSTDGGLTWSDPVTLVREGCGRLNDKNAITADPNDSRFVYAVWTRFGTPNGSANPSCLGSFNAEISSNLDGAASFDGPGWFSRSSDGGLSWEAPREVVSVAQGVGTVEHQIVVLPDGAGSYGDLLDFYVLDAARRNDHGARGQKLALIRSSDHGARWSSEEVVDEIVLVPTRDPLTGRTIRAFVTLDVAVDPATGNVYAVWKDGRFSADAWSEVAFAMSSDGGTTWTAPIKVNLTTAPQPGNRQAFLPSVAVSYYDLRFNGSDASPEEPLETDLFVARCRVPSASEPDRCEGNWAETRVTSASFDLRRAPNAGGFFLGDYAGLAALLDGFGALFAQANDDSDQATVYFSPIPSKPAP